ncbi:MAG: acyl carrier protein phosphodiesterase [Saprospiraceae bacterium]|nr:acyl carrier protein phosphodiesterase [Saprospiraceae bacterium]
MAGNFIADFLNKKEQLSLDPSLRNGVEMHQWIDQYTDSHQNISKFNKFFHPVIHHYAPVASDIIMDYFLYLNWEKYISIPYEEFADFTYNSLISTNHLFPEKPRKICIKMIENNWLQQYTSLDGISDVMTRMNHRAKFKVDFCLTLPVITTNSKIMNVLFQEFFERAMFVASQYSLKLKK